VILPTGNHGNGSYWRVGITTLEPKSAI